jgi:hypothetical protein
MGFVTLVFMCAACASHAQANPLLVMSIPARREDGRYVPDPEGSRQPICEVCARRLLARFEREDLPVPPLVQQPDYFERAYHSCADESDV